MVTFEEIQDSEYYTGNVFDVDTGLVCYNIPTRTKNISYHHFGNSRKVVALNQMRNEFEDTQDAGILFGDPKEGNMFAFSKKTRVPERYSIVLDDDASSSYDATILSDKRELTRSLSNFEPKTFFDVSCGVLKEIYVDNNRGYIEALLSKHRGYFYVQKKEDFSMGNTFPIGGEPEHLTFFKDINVTDAEKIAYIESVVRISNDVLSKLDTRSNFSTLKSMLQKLIRLRSCYVDLNDFHCMKKLLDDDRTPVFCGEKYAPLSSTNVPTDMFIVTVACKIACSQGVYNANVKRLIPGMEILYARLATIIIEDSYVRFGSGLMSYHEHLEEFENQNKKRKTDGRAEGKTKKKSSLDEAITSYDEHCQKAITSRLASMRLHDVFYKYGSYDIAPPDIVGNRRVDRLKRDFEPSEKPFDSVTLDLATANSADDIAYLLGNALYMKYTPTRIQDRDYVDVCYVIRLALNAWAEPKRMRYNSADLKLEYRDFFGSLKKKMTPSVKKGGGTDGDVIIKEDVESKSHKKRKILDTIDESNIFYFQLNGKNRGYSYPECYSHVVSACFKNAYGGMKGVHSSGGVLSGDERMFYSVAFEDSQSATPFEELLDFFRLFPPKEKKEMSFSSPRRSANAEKRLYMDSFFDVMRIEHCMDQHCFSQIGYMFGKRLIKRFTNVKINILESFEMFGSSNSGKKKNKGDFYDLFQLLFGNVTGQNPRLTFGGMRKSLLYGNVSLSIKDDKLNCDVNVERFKRRGCEDGSCLKNPAKYNFFDAEDYAVRKFRKMTEDIALCKRYGAAIRYFLQYFDETVAYIQKTCFATQLSKHADLSWISENVSKDEFVETKPLESNLSSVLSNRDRLNYDTFLSVLKELTGVPGIPSCTYFRRLVFSSKKPRNFEFNTNYINSDPEHNSLHTVDELGAFPDSSIEKKISKSDFQMVKTVKTDSEFICGSLPIIVCSKRYDPKFDGGEYGRTMNRIARYALYLDGRSKKFNDIHAVDWNDYYELDDITRQCRVSDLWSKWYLSNDVSDLTKETTEKDGLNPFPKNSSVVSVKTQKNFDWFRFLSERQNENNIVSVVDGGAVTAKKTRGFFEKSEKRGVMAKIPKSLKRLMNFTNYVMIPKTTKQYDYAIVQDLESNLEKLKIINKHSSHQKRGTKNGKVLGKIEFTDIGPAATEVGKISDHKKKIAESIVSSSLETYHKMSRGTLSKLNKDLKAYALLKNDYHTKTLLTLFGEISDFNIEQLQEKSFDLVKKEMTIAATFVPYEFKMNALFVSESKRKELIQTVMGDMRRMTNIDDNTESSAIDTPSSFCATAEYIFSSCTLSCTEVNQIIVIEDTQDVNVGLGDKKKQPTKPHTDFLDYSSIFRDKDQKTPYDFFCLSEASKVGLKPNYLDTVEDTLYYKEKDYKEALRSSYIATLSISDVSFALAKYMMIQKDVRHFFSTFSKIDFSADCPLSKKGDKINSQIYQIMHRRGKIDPKWSNELLVAFLSMEEYVAFYDFMHIMDVSNDYSEWFSKVAKSIQAISSDDHIRCAYDFVAYKTSKEGDIYDKLIPIYGNLVKIANGSDYYSGEISEDKYSFSVPKEIMRKPDFVRYIMYVLHKAFSTMYTTGIHVTASVSSYHSTSKVVMSRYVTVNDCLGFILYKKRNGDTNYMFRWFDAYESETNHHLLSKYFRKIREDDEADEKDKGSIMSLLENVLTTWKNNDQQSQHLGAVIKDLRLVENFENSGVFTRTQDHGKKLELYRQRENTDAMILELERWFGAFYMRYYNVVSMCRLSKKIAHSSLFTKKNIVRHELLGQLNTESGKRIDIEPKIIDLVKSWGLGISSLKRTLTHDGDGVMVDCENVLKPIIRSNIYEKGDWLGFCARHMTNWTSRIKFPRISRSGGATENPVYLSMSSHYQIMSILATLYPAFIKRLRSNSKTSQDTDVFDILDISAFKHIGKIILETAKYLKHENFGYVVTNGRKLDRCWADRYIHGKKTVMKNVKKPSVESMDVEISTFANDGAISEPRGLNNGGNTCYHNAIMQGISRLNCVYDMCLDPKVQRKSNKIPLWNQFIKTVLAIREDGKNGPLGYEGTSNSKLMDIMRTRSPKDDFHYPSLGTLFDASEALEFLLSDLDSQSESIPYIRERWKKVKMGITEPPDPQYLSHTRHVRVDEAVDGVAKLEDIIEKAKKHNFDADSKTKVDTNVNRDTIIYYGECAIFVTTTVQTTTDRPNIVEAPWELPLQNLDDNYYFYVLNSITVFVDFSRSKKTGKKSKKLPESVGHYISLVRDLKTSDWYEIDDGSVKKLKAYEYMTYWNDHKHYIPTVFYYSIDRHTSEAIPTPQSHKLFDLVDLYEAGSGETPKKLSDRTLFEYQRECIKKLLTRRGIDETPKTKCSFLKMDVGAGKTTIVFEYMNELLNRGLLCPYVIYITQSSAVSSLLIESRNFGFDVNIVTPMKGGDSKLFSIAGKTMYECRLDQDGGSWLTLNGVRFKSTLKSQVTSKKSNVKPSYKLESTEEGGSIYFDLGESEKGVSEKDPLSNFLPFAINIMDYDTARAIDKSIYNKLSEITFSQKDFTKEIFEAMRDRLKKIAPEDLKNSVYNFDFKKLAGNRGYFLIGDEIHDTLKTTALKRENALEMLENAYESLVLTGTPVANSSSAELIQRYLSQCVKYPVNIKNSYTAMESMISVAVDFGHKIEHYVLDFRHEKKYKYAKRNEWLSLIQDVAENGSDYLEYLDQVEYLQKMVGDALSSESENAYKESCKKQTTLMGENPYKGPIIKSKDIKDLLNNRIAKEQRIIYDNNWTPDSEGDPFYTTWSEEEWSNRNTYYRSANSLKETKKRTENKKNFILLCKIVMYRVKLTTAFNRIARGHDVLLFIDSAKDIELMECIIDRFLVYSKTIKNANLRRLGAKDENGNVLNYVVTDRTFDYRTDSDKATKNYGLVVIPFANNAGFNMTLCDTVIYAYYKTSVSDYEQAIGRVNRVGQKRNVSAIAVFCDYFLFRYVIRIMNQDITNNTVEALTLSKLKPIEK